LRECFEEHLAETEAQIERLSECFALLGEAARAKPCKGMMGLVEQGQEVISEGQEKEDTVADLALIGAAQRVEHYEISGYTTAKNLAQQLRHSGFVSLLSKSLAEEENADQLLNQIARTSEGVVMGVPLSRADKILWPDDGEGAVTREELERQRGRAPPSCLP
jgi:Mn-containing catalase